MALTLSNSFESGQVNGTAISTGNSGGGAGSAWDSVTNGTGATSVYSTTALRGTLSGLFTVGATSGTAKASWTTSLGGAKASLQGRFTVQPVALGGAAGIPVHRFVSSGTQAARISIESSGAITVRNSASTILATSVGTMTTADTWLIRYNITFGTSGSATVFIHYDPTNPVPDETLTASAAAFTGSVDELGVGVAASVTNTAVRLDDIITTDQGVPSIPVVPGTAVAALGGLVGSMVGTPQARVVTGTAGASLGQLVGTMSGNSTVFGTGFAALGGLDGILSQATYLFTPPQRTMTVSLRGSLRYSYPVSETVWKDSDGVWQHAETPAGDLLLSARRLMAYGGRPEIVDAATALELTLAGVGTISPPVALPPPPPPPPVFGFGRASLGSLTGTLTGHVPPVVGTGTGLALLGPLSGTMTGSVKSFGTGAVNLGSVHGTATGASPVRLGATWANGSVASGSAALNATVTYTRIYSAGDPTGWGTANVTDAQAMLAPGGILHFSFKNTPTSTNVNTFMNGIPAGTTVWLTYHHEDEQGTGGDIPLAQYKADWATLRTLCDAHPKRNQVVLVGVLTEFRCTFGGENWQDWWTGHEDKMAVDTYNATSSGPAYRAPSDIWNIASQVASVTGFPAAIPEYGAGLVSGDTSGSGRIACVNSQIAYLRANPGIADAVAWFSLEGFPTLTNDLSTDTNLQDAWRALCNSQ